MAKTRRRRSTRTETSTRPPTRPPTGPATAPATAPTPRRRPRQALGQGIRQAAAQAAGRVVSSANLGESQGPARHRPVRGTGRRRQGRHHQGHHGARQPTRVPDRGPAGAVRPREVADVHAALHAALPQRRRGRALRSQLVQPGRGRAGDGLLLEGAARAVPAALPGVRALHRRWRHHPGQVLARGEQQGTGEAIPGQDQGPGAAVEAQSDGPAVARAVVRLLARPRSDARGDRHRLRALGHRAVGRQEARPAQRDRAPVDA